MTLDIKKMVLRSYQFVLAIAAIVIFFTNLDNFLFNLEIFPKPLLLIVGLGVASIPLFFSRLKYIPLPIFAWCSAFLTICLTYSLFSNFSEIQVLQDRLRSIFFLLVTIVVFSGDKSIIIWVRRAIVLVSIINVFNNFYELINPSIFGLLNITGRAAGFYIKPN